MTRTATRTTGGCRLHAPQNGVLNFRDLALSLTGTAGFVGGAWRLFFALHFNFFLNALGNFLEAQTYTNAQITAFGPALSATESTAKSTTEGATENIAKLTEYVIHIHATTTKTTTFKGLMTKLIVARLFIGIAEHLISLCGLFKVFFSLCVSGVFIRMIFNGLLAISLLDFTGTSAF